MPAAQSVQSIGAGELSAGTSPMPPASLDATDRSGSALPPIDAGSVSSTSASPLPPSAAASAVR